MLLVVAAITFKFYRKFYCTCDQSLSVSCIVVELLQTSTGRWTFIVIIPVAADATGDDDDDDDSLYSTTNTITVVQLLLLLLAGVKAGRVHLCRVAGNTV